MNLSNLALNLHGPWMIDPEHAALMLPMLKSVLKGYILESDNTPKAHKVACSDYISGEKFSPDSFDGQSIYVTYLTGTMLRHDSCGNPGTKKIGRELLAADKEVDVIGHIIVAESGGGNADSVTDISDAIQSCSKPVVAWVDGVAASACIYAISYAQKILAHNSHDRVGCIGTMIELSGYGKFAKREDGFVTCRIYADPSEEKNLEYEQALAGNDKLIKENLLNPLSAKFISDMKTNRPNCTDEQLKGRTYFAKDVVGTLVDSIGSFQDAVNAVLELSKSNETQSKNKTTMKNYPNLALLHSLSEQVIAEDGSTTLQASQLQEIEEAFAAAVKNSTSLKEKETEIASLNSQIAEKDATIAKNAERIKELEASLNAAIAKVSNPEPMDLSPSGNPEGSEEQTATSFEEAVASCKKFLEKHN